MMQSSRNRSVGTPAVLVLLASLSLSFSEIPKLPPFGRDTVLVWKMDYGDDSSEFVVRIAKFLPDRFIEWETATTQGTVFMSAKAIRSSRSFVNARLFEAGVDTKGNESTTLWLSQQTFRDLKLKGKLKLSLDSIDSWITLDGTEELSLDVNRSTMVLPAIKVKDDRYSDRWFLDFEDNPLLVKHTSRHFSQTLTSIATDKSNTLRWIKGKKLTAPH